jgi:hypothetical protein
VNLRLKKLVPVCRAETGRIYRTISGSRSVFAAIDKNTGNFCVVVKPIIRTELLTTVQLAEIVS